MASTRVQKSVKNAAYGLVAQVLTVVLNFVARVKFVSIIGIAANGLNGLFTEVVAMLSLAELGVGSAITYSLYKPLAQNDREKISQIMWLFKTAYRIIAAVIFVAGVILMPFVHLIVKETDFEVSYIRRIFLLFVLRAVSTYLMSYKTSLLIADQKSYVTSAINAVSKIFCTAVGIAVIVFCKSFELYLIVIIAFNLISNVCITVYSRKHYDFINKSDRLPKEECKSILSNIRHIFISQLSGKITNSTDNILISVLVNTVATGIYSNYSLIITNVKIIFQHVMSSITGSFGNLMVTESMEKCERTTRNLIFGFFSLGVFLGGGFICASTPFMLIFFGDKCLIDDFTLFVCSFNMCISVWTLPLWHIVTVSGMFKKDKFISIAGSTINLIVSIILGKMMGMVGIFIGTTCTYTVQMLLKLYLLYTEKYKIPPLRYILRTIMMYATALCIIFAEKAVCDMMSFNSLWLTFFVRGFSSAVMTFITVVVLFGRSNEFKYFLNLILKRLKKGWRKSNEHN